MRFWLAFPLAMVMLGPFWLGWFEYRTDRQGITTAEGTTGIPPHYAEGTTGIPPHYAEGTTGIPPH